MRCLILILVVTLTVCLTAPPAFAGFLGTLREHLTRTEIRPENPGEVERSDATTPGRVSDHDRKKIRIEPGIDDPLVKSGLDNPALFLGKLDYTRLISDFAMTNTESMTEDDIQKLLDANRSVLAKDYNGGKPAAMILAAAKKHGISPKILCATLQKEQGLITKTTASQRKLDWALGVGAYDNGTRVSAYKGFDKQIDGAAQTLRKLFNEAAARFDAGEKTITIKTLAGEKVNVRNAATWALFKYSPHLSSNKLFHQVYKRFEERGWAGWSDPKVFNIQAPPARRIGSDGPSTLQRAR